MPEPIYLLYDYLEYLKKIKEDNSPNYLSELIRRFVRNYSDFYDIENVLECCALDAFKEAYPDININKSYFKKVCNDEWMCEIYDGENGKYTCINVNREKLRKKRW